MGGFIGTPQEATRNEQLTITNSSSTICDARTGDNARKVLIVRNTSDDATKIITLNLGAKPAVANQGIVLKQGESFVDAQDSGYLPFQGTITAICAVASATADLTIFER